MLVMPLLFTHCCGYISQYLHYTKLGTLKQCACHKEYVFLFRYSI